MGKGRLFIGTSGYSYNHWKGVFYPDTLSEAKWLEHYAKYFDTAELNVTFYRLPQSATFSGWYGRTPGGFRFAIKGSRFITHIKRLKGCGGPLKLFFSRAKLLKEKLGPVLWQLPPSFKADPGRLENFLRTLKKYKGTKHVFEFRNETWFSDDIFKMLKSRNASLSSADRPAFCDSIHETADFIYIRRHGQGANLYGGCYTKSQLKKDAEIIKKHLKTGKDVYIYFNNDAHGYAVKNAKELKTILGQ